MPEPGEHPACDGSAVALPELRPLLLLLPLLLPLCPCAGPRCGSRRRGREASGPARLRLRGREVVGAGVEISWVLSSEGVVVVVDAVVDAAHLALWWSSLSYIYIGICIGDIHTATADCFTLVAPIEASNSQFLRFRKVALPSTLIYLVFFSNL